MTHQKPCIKFKLLDNQPGIFDSKAGGLGYIPHDGDFPLDKDGEQLRLLAQIDCSQVDFEPFPKSGLLQFWIHNCEDYGGYGLAIQDTFRVIYYPEVDKSVTKEEIQSKFIHCDADDDEDTSPVLGEFGMEFSKGESFDFEELREAEAFDESPETDSVHHQIGGYPYFTQDDPREEDSPYDFLLFQLDSDYADKKDIVLWGDAGIGNFFINSEKLKNLDFSDVLYNWDCC